MKIVNMLKKCKQLVPLFCSFLTCVNEPSFSSQGSSYSGGILSGYSMRSGKTVDHIQSIVECVKNDVLKPTQDPAVSIPEFVRKASSIVLNRYDKKIAHLALSDRVFFYITVFSKGTETLFSHLDVNNPQNVHTFDVLSENVCDIMMADPTLACFRNRVLDGSLSFNKGVLEDVCENGDEESYVGLVAMYKAFHLADTDNKLCERINFLANLSGYLICKEKEYDKNAATLMPCTIAENVATQGGCVNGYVTRMLEILNSYSCISDSNLRNRAFAESELSGFSNIDQVNLREAIRARPEIEQFMSPEKFALNLLKIALKHGAKPDQHVGALEYAMMYRAELEKYWKMNIGEALEEISLLDFMKDECDLSCDSLPNDDLSSKQQEIKDPRQELSEILYFLIDKSELPECKDLSDEVVIDKIIDELSSKVDSVSSDVNTDDFYALSRAFIINMIANYNGSAELERYLEDVNTLIKIRKGSRIAGMQAQCVVTNTQSERITQARNDILKYIDLGLISKKGAFNGFSNEQILDHLVQEFKKSKMILHRDMEDGLGGISAVAREFYENISSDYVMARDLLDKRLKDINLLVSDAK